MTVTQDPAGFTPNPQQAAVLQWYQDGVLIERGRPVKRQNLNLVAFAGCGKTATLIQLLRYVEGRTLFCAFGRDIKKEIETRVEGHAWINKQNLMIKTVHGFCMSVWRRSCSGFKLVVNDNKIRNMVRELGREEAVYADNFSFLVKVVQHAKQAGFGVLNNIGNRAAWEELIDHFSLEESIETETPVSELISLAIGIYKSSLKLCRHELDYSDMILAPLYYKCRFPKYDNVLVDEAQDISPLRLAAIAMSVKPNTRIVAVGDPNQAIFGFTGADDESLDAIRDRFDSGELPLSVSYRCPKVAIAEAQEYVPGIQAHPSAPMGNKITCWLKPKQQARVTDGPAVLEPPQTGFWDLGPFTNDDVILCRNCKPLVALAYDFIKRGLPAYVEGAEIGEDFIKLARRFEIADLSELEVALEEYRKKELERFHKLDQEAKAALFEDRLDTLLVLIQATKERKAKANIDDLVGFITNLFGDTPDGQRPRCITLSSIHKAKGREWKRVFILGRQKFMPSKWAKKAWEKKQEANLGYVAVTRAKETRVDIIMPD